MADINLMQTLCVLSGGSIITNVSITSPVINVDTLNNNVTIQVPYYIAIASGQTFDQNIYNDDINGSKTYLMDIFDPYFTAFQFQGQYHIFPQMGSPLLINSQIYIAGFQIDIENYTPVDGIIIPHVQFLIEYLSEENLL